MTKNWLNIGFNDVLLRLILLTLVWSLLTNANVESMFIGFPAIILALLVSLLLVPSFNFSWVPFFQFIPFFLWRSLIGGFDVAVRALSPGMKISPSLVSYPLSLPDGLPSVFMVAVVNLLPGTLIVQLEKGTLHIHVIDDTRSYFDELRVVEKWVASIFSISSENEQV